MPPLWLIIGAVVIIGIPSAIDRMILKPRGTTIVVDGRAVAVRRKRDGLLLWALQAAIITSFFVVGFAVFEGASLIFVLLLAIPFAGAALWSLRRALGEDDRLPTDDEVSVGVRAASSINRHAWQVVGVGAVQIALGALTSATYGVLFWMALVTSFILAPIELFLLWRFLRALRTMRADSTSG